MKPKQIRNLAEHIETQLLEFNPEFCPGQREIAGWIADYARNEAIEEADRDWEKATNFSEMLK